MRFLPICSGRWLVAALPTLLLACSSPARNDDPAAAAAALNEHKIDAADVTDKQRADADFLVKLSSNALLEVELGKLAQSRAATPAVRGYGPRLVQNRLELLTALRALAAAKQLVIPSSLGADQQAAYHEVNEQPGNKLDRRLMDIALKAQKQDDNALDDMKDDAYDGDIRGFAAKFAQPVHDHREAAEDVEDVLDDLP